MHSNVDRDFAESRRIRVLWSRMHARLLPAVITPGGVQGIHISYIYKNTIHNREKILWIDKCGINMERKNKEERTSIHRGYLSYLYRYIMHDMHA